MRNIKCRNCINLRREWCERVWDSTDPDLVRDCSFYREKTNADHIRSMTDEELAEWYGEGMCGGQTVDACRKKFHGNCSACALDWLKQPYKEEA